MAIQYTTTVRNNRLNEVTAAAGAAAWLQVWDGALPSTPDATPAGTLLASCSMSNPIAPNASSGVLTMSAIANDTSAAAGGTPTFARIASTETGATSGVTQMSAGVGSGDLSFDAPVVILGTVTVSSLVITDGSA